jgi:hypothetical protein
MAAILAEMDGDRVSAGMLGDTRRFEDIRLGWQSGFPPAITGLAQGGNMIDVQSKFGHGPKLGPFGKREQ